MSATVITQIQQLHDEAEKNYDPMNTTEMSSCDAQEMVIEAYARCLNILKFDAAVKRKVGV